MSVIQGQNGVSVARV